MYRFREWHVYLITLIVACVVTFFALQLWDANWAIPFEYDGTDALPTAAHFKDTIATGWYDFNPLLGAPYGQTFNDFPESDNLPIVFALLLSVFTHNYAIVLNVFYVLGYPLIALSALWFLRRLGVSRFIAMSLAVVYAIAPYHFYRSEMHLYLASYFVVPLSLGVVMMAMRGERLWGRGTSKNRLVSVIWSPATRTVVIAALTGTAESYYCLFFLILLAFAGVVRLIYSGKWTRFWGAAMAGVAAAIALFLNLLPNLIYSWQNGTDVGALDRSHIETEIYALKLTQLLLPWEGSRIGIFARLRQLYDTTYPLPSEDPALGLIGAVGLVALFLILGYSATTWGRNRALSGPTRSAMTLVGQLAALTFVAFLFSTIGGLSTIVSFVTTALRGWNRMSIFIELLSLTAVGILIDLLIRWIVARRHLGVGRRVLAISAAALLLIVAFVDQTPATLGAGYAVTAARYEADDVWIKTIQDDLPRSAIVLELPYQPFPESVTPSGINSDDQDIPYLHSDSLRWTGAGIKGRPRADWPGSLATYSGQDIVKLAAAAGMDGIDLDRAAYGPGWQVVEEQIESELRRQPIVSADNRYSFFNLTSYRAKQEKKFGPSELATVRARVLNPLILTTGAGLTPVTTGTGLLVSTTAASTFTITNAAKHAIHATLTLPVTAESGATASDVELASATGTRTLTPFVGSKALVRLPVIIPVGTSTFQLQLVGAALGTDGTVQLATPTLREKVIDQFLAR